MIPQPGNLDDVRAALGRLVARAHGAAVAVDGAAEAVASVIEGALPGSPLEVPGEGVVLLADGSEVGFAWGACGGVVVLAVRAPELGVVVVGVARGRSPWTAWPALEGPGPRLVEWARGLALDRVQVPASVALELAREAA